MGAKCRGAKSWEVKCRRGEMYQGNCSLTPRTSRDSCRRFVKWICWTCRAMLSLAAYTLPHKGQSFLLLSEKSYVLCEANGLFPINSSAKPTFSFSSRLLSAISVFLLSNAWKNKGRGTDNKNYKKEDRRIFLARKIIIPVLWVFKQTTYPMIILWHINYVIVYIIYIF